ncbi:MAG: hypothetical protein H7X70_05315 [Candidatus Kapabacteria bacterium]|nr:hypothetical protein [Candidatus Kapabacteria bacterium]
MPMRLSDGIAFPRAMALGKTIPGITELVATCIADEARALGVHWNWAPVADINSNPLNPIINTRSFGESAEVVSAHAAAYVRGTQSRYVMACAKHAPGHGDTQVDSHMSLPTINVSREVAQEREFAPFKSCIDAGVRSIMVAHILVPFLDSELPASLSRQIVTELIRESWNFTGLITTDAMDMKSISDGWSSGDAALRAIHAGVDVVLMPHKPHEAIDAIMSAIEAGAITDEQLAASEARLDEARAFVGVRSRLSDAKPLTRDRIVVDQSAHAMIALKAADAAIRVEGKLDVLPITQFTQVAAFAVIDESETDIATTWFQSLARGTEIDVDFGFVDTTITDEDLRLLHEGIVDAQLVVFVLFGKAVAFKGELTNMTRIPQIIEQIAADKTVLIVACGSPYGIDVLPAHTRLYTYSDTLPSLAASVMRLIGRAVNEN